MRLPALVERRGAARHPPARGRPRRPREPRKVLIADDNADAATALAVLLGSPDTRCTMRGRRRRGPRVAARFTPDVVVLDLAMPRLNGYDVARRIRQEPWGRNVLLIALTGWAKDEDRKRTKEAGFDVHLVKPVPPAVLLELLAGPLPSGSSSV